MPKKIKISIIGGGSSYTPEFIDHVIKFYDKLPVSNITLIDLPSNLERLEIARNFSQSMVDKLNIPIQIESTTDRLKGLEDSNYVVIQIRVGKMEARYYDETIPSEYGLLGHETFGLGGLFNALRTVPVIYEMIEDIKNVCPQAWVLNVTNPTGIISEAVFRYAEFDKFIGICSDPVQMTVDLANALNVDKNEVIPYFAGINHLSFVTSLFYNHKNHLPEILKNDKILDSFQFDKTYLKHLESYPHLDFDYYINYDQMLDKHLKSLRHKDIRASKVQDIEKVLFEYYSDINNPYDPLKAKLRKGYDFSQQCLEVIEGIQNNTKNYMVLNVMNRGHITDLSEDCSIEITCRITNKGPMPVHIGRLPLQIRGIIQHVKAYEELLVDAIYEKKINKALMAFQNHPHTTSFIKTKNAFDALYEKNKQHLTYYGEYIK